MNKKKYFEALTTAVESMDVDTFREFARKYKPLMYGATDEVLEITMRKVALYLPTINTDIKEQAREWLISRGYSTKL